MKIMKEKNLLAISINAISKNGTNIRVQFLKMILKQRMMRKWYFLLSFSNIVERVNTWRKGLKSNSLDIKRYRSLFGVKDRRSTSRSIEESHGSREAPPNRESCSSSKLLTSSAIGRHLARHCFIHACCTFLVYLVQSLLVSFYISRDIL